MPGGKHVPGATPKENRQYEHIKKSEESRGVSTPKAKQIAAASVNKQRAASGEAKTTGGKPNPKHK